MAAKVITNLQTRRDEFGEPTDLESGAISRFAGSLFLLIAPIGFLGAYPLKPTLLLLLSLIAIGALFLLPRESLLRLRLSPALIAYVAWAMASLSWSESPSATLFLMRSVLPAVVAMAVVAAFLPIATWQLIFARSMEIIVVITLLAILTSSAARATVGANGVDVAGWRGYFIHKNVMSPALSVAVVTILAFETNRRAAWAFVLAVTVILVPSHSATGLIALMLGLSTWVLTGWMARSAPRERSMTAITLALGGVFLVGVGVRSAAYWVGAFDKDITFTGRTEIWAASAPYLAERPWTGYGLAGPYGALSNVIARDIFDTIGFYVVHAHNGLMDLMATLGLVGVAIVVTLIVVTVRDAWLVIEARPELSRWVLTLMAVILFTSFTENTLAPHYVAVIGAARILVMRERGAMKEMSVARARDQWRRQRIESTPEPGLFASGEQDARSQRSNRDPKHVQREGSVWDPPEI